MTARLLHLAVLLLATAPGRPAGAATATPARRSRTPAREARAPTPTPTLAPTPTPAGVPELELRDLAGAWRKLSDLRGSVVVLSFWATWCPPCRAELPALAAVARRHEAPDVVVIAAAADGDAERVTRFLRDARAELTAWLSVSASDMRPFGLTEALPATVILDRAGRVAWRKQGAVGEEELGRELARLGAAPEPTGSRAP